LVHDEAPEAPATAPAPAAPAPAAPVVAAPVAEPTLHDFVLNLLRDPSAQQAFDLDPIGCLTAAGLTDLTPVDVHDVIPLVMDLVPTEGLGGLENLTSSLSVDGGAGIDGAWGTVGAETPLGTLDGAGQLRAGLEGVTTGVVAHQETPLGTFGVGAGLEASEHGVHGGTGVYTPFASVETAFAAQIDDDGLYLDAGLSTDGALDDFASVTLDTSDGLVDGLEIHQDIIPGVSGNVTDLAKGLSDPTALAGALVGAVPALPALPQVPGLPGLGELPGVLPALPALPVDLPQLPALPVEHVTEHVTEVVDHVQETVGGVVDGAHVGELPNVVGHLPQLPDVLGHLPVELPHLPVDLPQLPVNLPIVGDASGHGPVGDIVDHTGLGGVINNNPVTDVVHDVVPDLHLGL
jgi:hypothetical protein